MTKEETRLQELIRKHKLRPWGDSHYLAMSLEIALEAMQECLNSFDPHTKGVIIAKAFRRIEDLVGFKKK